MRSVKGSNKQFVFPQGTQFIFPRGTLCLKRLFVFICLFFFVFTVCVFNASRRNSIISYLINRKWLKLIYILAPLLDGLSMGKHKQVSCKICYRTMRSDYLKRHMKQHEKRNEAHHWILVRANCVRCA